MNPSESPSRDASSASPTRLPTSTPTEAPTTTTSSANQRAPIDSALPPSPEGDVPKLQGPTYASVTATPSPAATIPTSVPPPELARSHTLLDLPSYLGHDKVEAVTGGSTAARSFTSPTPASAPSANETATASIASGTVSLPVSKASHSKMRGGRKSGIPTSVPMGGDSGGKERKREGEGKGRLILEKFDLYETKLVCLSFSFIDCHTHCRSKESKLILINGTEILPNSVEPILQ